MSPRIRSGKTPLTLAKRSGARNSQLRDVLLQRPGHAITVPELAELFGITENQASILRTEFAREHGVETMFNVKIPGVRLPRSPGART
jgi:hypothetical protein